VSEHRWKQFEPNTAFMTWACSVCGICRRADGGNKACPGKAPIIAVRTIQELENENTQLRADRDRLALALETMERKWATAVAFGCVIEKERDEARAFIVRAANGDPAVTVGELLAQRSSALAEVEALRGETKRLQGLLMEAFGALEDWHDCDEKAQHTNTLVALAEEFERLCKPSDATLQPFRDALSSTTPRGKGGADE
jgi:hypothetical protein